MANPEHLEILKQGVEQWNKWREEHADVLLDLFKADLGGAKLSGADLSRADLGGANLQRADLGGANLSGADLMWSDLSGANMDGADLSKADLEIANLRDAELREADLNMANLSGANIDGADLSGANFIRASVTDVDLRGANFHGADLRETDLSRARLTGTDFTGTQTRGTIFADVDLSTAKGLETIKHWGASTIGIDTIYKSRGKIPEVFLRGCGVPDEFIAYIGSMVGRSIEFYSCFISYSTHDQEFAERLHADLQAKGVRCWFAPEEMKGGRKLHEQIDEAIRLHDKLLLILSEHSMSSDWVKTEIANAREREKKEGKQLLFPITLVPFEAVKQWKLFDADIGRGLGARDTRVLHPRLQQLEGARLVSNGV